MRISIALPIVAAFATAAIALSGPSAATDLKQALKLCNRHGMCQVDARGKADVSIKYKDNEITCPKGGGACTCHFCNPPKERTGSSGTVKTGGGVLNAKVTNGGGLPAAKNPVLGGGIAKYNRR
jgi:hypothetical protein